MSLFDQLVDQAMQATGAQGTVRAAVEKELLHHDILRELSRAGLLASLTFIGGTCMRACYGSPRLSEDLDFTGGADFNPERLSPLVEILESTLMEKYGLPVGVSPPERETGNVSTWKMRMTTRPGSSHLPAKHIHIDICALDSYQARPSLLRNHYGVDMGTDGLIVKAESREEILADKWVALAFRLNRLQYRDLWDILWLDRQGVRLDASLVMIKVEARQHSSQEFQSNLNQRLDMLADIPAHERDFTKEMQRFLPPSVVQKAIGQPDFWTVLMLNLRDQAAIFNRA